MPRKYALLPLLTTTCYIPLGQMVVVAGLHFQFYRILLLLGWCRAVIRKDYRGISWSPIDKCFLWWSSISLVVGTLTDPTLHRFTNRCGLVYSAIGTYFLVRFWLRNLETLASMIRSMAWIILPLGLSMLVEKSTGRNLFSAFGGVPYYSEVRNGVLRCQGAFRHPILAGTYGVTFLPLFMGLWRLGRGFRRSSVVGVASAACITLTSHSSGALLTLFAVLGGFALWPLRWRMKLFRAGVVASILVLALVMKPPVWFIFAKASLISGGTGWHRSYLIDQAINHFNEWWLVGSTYTAHWAPGGEVLPDDPNNMDITNQYIEEGLAGGIWKLSLFLMIIVACYRTVGVGWRATMSQPERWLIWSLGVCLSAHCISFLSTTYFDQIIVMWYWLLAAISMLAVAVSEIRTKSRATERAWVERESTGVASRVGMSQIGTVWSNSDAPELPHSS